VERLVAPSLTQPESPPSKPLLPSAPQAAGAEVVTFSGALAADQLPAASRARTVMV
jgi:hypothetical protein